MSPEKKSKKKKPAAAKSPAAKSAAAKPATTKPTAAKPVKIKPESAKTAAKEPEQPPVIAEPEEAPVSGTSRGALPRFIVGMGGSAGALEAFEQFFRNMPENSGLAFILVPHLDPTHKGLMPELLQRFTKMTVSQIRTGMRVKADNVYVIPPNADIAILNGVLQLMEPSAPRGLRLPIDGFFRHLAQDQKDRAIAIILSGMGTDGTLGLRAIKEHMGMVMVQDPSSAKYDGMPRSAYDTGLIDIVAPAEELPSRLLSYVNHLSRVQVLPPRVEDKASSAIQKILLIIRSKTGTDFSLYKRNTVLRRIDRRMSVHQITNLTNYVSFLRENPNEVDLLFKELLINVTNFFRDAEAFEILREKAILPILRSHNGQGTVRVWVPGCSSGEEAYSIAILFRECIGKEPGLDVKVQIYGTDIDQDAISLARQGTYPENISADVSPERLQQFFSRQDSRYRIRKEIRDMVVFAPQNIIADPPFTKLDLLSCRNLLIYLTPEIQKRILPLFHYALCQNGYLFLGSSETISGYTDLFGPVDQKWKIFRRRENRAAMASLPDFPTRPALPEAARLQVQEKSAGASPAGSFQDTIHRLIVESVSPPVLIITRKGELLYSTRKTGRFFEPAVGNASLSIFDMAREGLRMELAIAVRQAASGNQEVTVPNLSVKTNGEYQQINLMVRPITGSEILRDLLMVVLEEVPEGGKQNGRRKKEEIDVTGRAAIAELEKELQYTKEHLQTTIEEMETSQEELKSANEELQSTNEELQSTNEELTTSKEELQSLNEELMTVNAELQGKNDELALTNNDMRNLLNSTQIPTVFLDNKLRIKRFTSPATSIFTLIPGDIGRPVTDIKSHLRYENFAGDIRSVLDTLVFRETQVQSDDGKWYIMRIMPYRTMENLIDGVVITFSDISDLKKLAQVLKEREQLRILAGVVQMADEAILVQDRDGKILAWNAGAERLFGWTEADVLGHDAREFVPPGDQASYNEVMEKIWKGGKVSSFRTRRLAKSGEPVEVTCSVRILTDDKGTMTSVATTEIPVKKSPAKKHLSRK